MVNFADVTGKCTVVYSENLNEEPYIWSKEGPFRFYFSEAYDSDKQETTEPSKLARQLGDVGKVSNAVWLLQYNMKKVSLLFKKLIHYISDFRVKEKEKIKWEERKLKLSHGLRLQKH